MNKILNQLSLPFHPSQVTWRPGAVNEDPGKALALPYVVLRAYQNRLDEVCGMDWSVSYTPWGDRIVCHLTIDGVTRSSTGEPDSADLGHGTGENSATVTAFRRACAMFGLGRYLDNLPSIWAEYDADAQRFTGQARARLCGIIAQHYQRFLYSQLEKIESE